MCKHMCVRTYVCVIVWHRYVHYIYIYRQIFRERDINKYIYIYIYLYIFIYTYIHTHTHMFTYIHACMYIYIYIYEYSTPGPVGLHTANGPIGILQIGFSGDSLLGFGSCALATSGGG